MPAEPDTFDLLARHDQTKPPDVALRRSKIERPGLPDETLRRDRLLEWLETRTHRRAVFVVAEAGYGKTTLLADFSRRTRIRTAWYRLDDEDADALGFLRYLVAACQAIDPRALQRSAALVAESGTATLDWRQILDAFIADLAPLGDEPLVLILDDYHVVEGCPAIRTVVERLLARAPERISFIFASRRTPDLAVARLRIRDELAELGREELRFDAAETDQLFRDGYHQPLEGDVLNDLHERTEGWAASLQLVRSAVTGRSPAEARRFVRTLSGAEGKLYDYLAEEVVGDLPPELLAFVMRVALLDEVDADVATVSARVPLADSRRLLAEAERIALISKPAPEGSRRIHPLVRDFLLARLECEIGSDGIAGLHREVARSLESRSWRGAAHHWAAAGEGAEVRRVIVAAVPTIIGRGEYETSAHFIDSCGARKPLDPWLDILVSRIAEARGDVNDALDAAERACRVAASTDDEGLRAYALLNLIYAAERAGRDELALVRPIEISEVEPDTEAAAILLATRAFADAAEDGSIDKCRAAIERVRSLSVVLGHKRNEGIALLDLGVLDRMQARFDDALVHGRRAISLLDQAGSRDEQAAAQLVVAAALGHLGRWNEAKRHIESAIATGVAGPGSELQADAAQLCALYGDYPTRASITPVTVGKTRTPCAPIADAWLALQTGDFEQARASIAEASQRRAIDTAFRSSVRALGVVLCAYERPELPPGAAAEAMAAAESQEAWYWAKVVSAAATCRRDAEVLSAALASCAESDRAYYSIAAELLARRITELTPEALLAVRDEVVLRPERWRRALRLAIRHATDRKELVAAGEMLELVGEAQDIDVLCSVAVAGRDRRSRELGKGLIRRLAPRVLIEDLGRVVLQIGERRVLGTDIRRRVLALLCFLVTRPQFAATREQVLDAIWPDQDPETAANSLNQTVYFLRRVLEPEYDEATTPGYVRHETDVIWLDNELVHSRSADSREAMRRVGADLSPDAISRVVDTYSNKFALDFTYEDWAAAHREALHATYLQLVERALARDFRCGEYDRAISLAHKAMAVDPDADEIEMSLLRLYRATGAHAAAAEQYAHYAAVMRGQLGLEPPTLESL